MTPILQSESSECTLASLAMVANAHGLQVDLSDLRRRFPVSLKGATLQQLITHAGGLNFSCRPLRLELEELAQLQLPCILHSRLRQLIAKFRLFWPAAPMKSTTYKRFSENMCNGTFGYL